MIIDPILLLCRSWKIFYILNFFGIIGKEFRPRLDAAIKLLDGEEKNIQQEAKTLAEKLLNKTPVIYSIAGTEGVSIRFRQQLNENSKELCWHQVVPEMNHNELVGWKRKRDDLAVVFFRNAGDFERSKTRIEVCKNIIAKSCSNIHEVYSKGNSALERALYLIHLGDWVSVFLAELKNIDPNEVQVIDFLKSELGKS